MNTMTIEERLSAILDEGCPLSELLGRLADLCEEREVSWEIVRMVKEAASVAERYDQ